MRAPTTRHPLHAFSLIEVTLALGICAFAIVGVFGLLAVSMDSSRSSGADTTLAAMTSEVQADLRGQSFTNVESGLLAQSLVYHFNNEGARLSSSNTTYLYECLVQGQGDPETKGAQNNLLNLTLQFSRQANGRKIPFKSLPLRLARYE